MNAKIRLYVDHPLGQGQSVPLDKAQAHYLFGVMRQSVGASVLLFNGIDGEWRAEVAEAGKRGGVLACAEQTKSLQMPPDLWLIFAPIKKARTDFIVEKAAEMGARRIVPVQSEFTNAGRVQRDRLQAHAVEAAEQCGGTFVPEVADMVRLDRLIDRWEPERSLMFCDEALAGEEGFGIDPRVLDTLSLEIGQLVGIGVQVGLVVGGGNLFRGAALQTAGHCSFRLPSGCAACFHSCDDRGRTPA